MPILLQNMGIEYDEAMETIHVIKRDGSVSYKSGCRTGHTNTPAEAVIASVAFMWHCTSAG